MVPSLLIWKSRQDSSNTTLPFRPGIAHIEYAPTPVVSAAKFTRSKEPTPSSNQPVRTEMQLRSRIGNCFSPRLEKQAADRR
jgi:hypothetical protein